MLANKTIQVFDRENLQIGDIVSLHRRIFGDEGEKVDDKIINGIIKNISDYEVEIITLTSRSFGLTIRDLEDDDYRIIGTAKSL